MPRRSRRFPGSCLGRTVGPQDITGEVGVVEDVLVDVGGTVEAGGVVGVVEGVCGDVDVFAVETVELDSTVL